MREQNAIFAVNGGNMDKAEFIRIAPTYYYAAVATALKPGWSGHFTIGTLRSYYTLTETDEDFLEHRELVQMALDKMVAEGAISESPDPFGDTLYQKTKLFDKLIENLEAVGGGPYNKNRVANNRNEWMRGALGRLNYQYRVLDLTAEDFAREVPDEWEPIRISPSEPAIQEAVRQLRDATTAIEQDNGYAATFPQERDQVVQDLKGGLDKLQSDTISVGWLRRTVNALKTASFRFANTVKGQMIDGALAAVRDVMKSHMGAAIEMFLSLFR